MPELPVTASIKAQRERIKTFRTQLWRNTRFLKGTVSP